MSTKLKELAEDIFIHLGVMSPSLRKSRKTIKIVLKENKIANVSGFGEFYDHKDCYRKFASDYLAYYCTIGFTMQDMRAK